MPKELRDQTAHAVAAMVIVLIIGFWFHPLTYALGGFLIGFVRELTEEGTPVTLAKAVEAVRTSKLDLMFWTIGGIAAWFVLALTM